MCLSRRMYWLEDGIIGKVSNVSFDFSTKSKTVHLRRVFALLKDVDYLPMAKSVRN